MAVRTNRYKMPEPEVKPDLPKWIQDRVTRSIEEQRASRAEHQHTGEDTW